MAIIQWNPWHELESLNQRLSHILDDSNETGLARKQRYEYGNWLPAVDIHESGELYTVVVDLPGIAKKDVKVEVEGRNLVISGERKVENEEWQKNSHLIERSFGRFVRSFALPSYVNTAEIKAKMSDGVLTVELSKQEGEKPKHITVE